MLAAASSVHAWVLSEYNGDMVIMSNPSPGGVVGRWVEYRELANDPEMSAQYPYLAKAYWRAKAVADEACTEQGTKNREAKFVSGFRSVSSASDRFWGKTTPGLGVHATLVCVPK